MSNPEIYPHSVSKLEQRKTHISYVFLTGPYAYKIKKPVDLEFLDYSTLEKRKHYCHQETSLNQRLSYDVYLGVVAITYDKGKYYLDGPGKPVEYAVKMRQLPDENSMLRLLRNRKIAETGIKQLAQRLSDFYQKALTDAKINTFGAWDMIQFNCEKNFRQTTSFMGDILDKRMFQIIRAASRLFLHRRKKLFKDRVNKKKIRDCHGDLRSGYIYFNDEIQIIDCIEFNERFRYADITSDLAFLAMDMDANIIFIKCVAPINKLCARLKNRGTKKASVSGARLHHLKQIMDRYELLTEIRNGRHIRINTKKPLKENIQRTLSHD
jgi:aminoglycoside phosphotransferase family enzyme